MKKFRPDRKALLTLRILTAAAAIFLLAAAKIYIPIDAVITIIAAALGIVVIFVNFIYLPLYFSSLVYETTSEQITRHGGVFFKSRKSVKFSTVQYTASVTTPFSRYTGLNFAVLFVYGGQLQLMFLAHSDAAEILSIVENCGKESKSDVS